MAQRQLKITWSEKHYSVQDMPEPLFHTSDSVQQLSRQLESIGLLRNGNVDVESIRIEIIER